jgi:hypothetical protein
MGGDKESYVGFASSARKKRECLFQQTSVSATRIEER